MFEKGEFGQNTSRREGLILGKIIKPKYSIPGISHVW